MQSLLKVATIQMVSNYNWQDNLKTAAALIKSAAAQGARLIVLPEFFIQISDSEKRNLTLEIAEELGSGVIQERLARIAQDNQIYLVAGTIPIKSPVTGKCYNTAIVYNPDGKMLCHYHKIHLFKYNNGKVKFDEGDRFHNGDTVTTFNADGLRFGLSVCYDLRFPELFRQMHNVDCIILPAAFLKITGQYHWEVLLRARAIENLTYVIASGQGGIHENGRHTFGHSMIINPWGEIIDTLPEGAGFVTAVIDKNYLTEVRTQLPALDHRKL